MRRYRDDPRWITAKWQGRCEACGRIIPRGHRAFYYPLTRTLYCERCGKTEEADFLSHAADEDFYLSLYRDPMR